MEATVSNLPPAASPELTKAYHRDWLLIPIEVWPNISTAATALSADEVGLDIGQRTRARLSTAL